MPVNYKKYPPDWKTKIRPRILNRAENKCEFCGVENGAIIRRNKEAPKKFWVVTGNETPGQLIWLDMFFGKEIKVILTVAHLDHDAENWNIDDKRLKALCQRCHLNYDRGIK